jgi:hypothetical protein
VTGAVVLTCVLWLASLTVGLGCVVLSTLLRQWIPRYAIVDRPRFEFRSPDAVDVFIIRHGSLRNVEAILRILREWLLVAVFLFIWGLDIRLLHTANSPSPLVIIGLSFTFITGLCLILAAWPRPAVPLERSGDTGIGALRCWLYLKFLLCSTVLTLIRKLYSFSGADRSRLIV